MRLSHREINIIISKAKLIFDDAIVYLFGSRTDDSKSGGDIDLYIVTNIKNNIFQKKLKLQIILEDILYKPVDVIISQDKNRLIEKEALKGIKIN